VDVADELVGMQTKFVSSGSADKLCLQVLQTKFVCTGSPDRQTLQTNFVCRKSAETWPKCRQILQTNFVCRKSAETWAKMQTNPADKLCLQFLQTNFVCTGFLRHSLILTFLQLPSSIRKLRQLSLICSLMQKVAPLRAGPAQDRWYPVVRPNPAEDRI
jgi:hypothetical protein